ncbi:DUF2158 domain-containing protein [Dyella sp. GSA-30]|uniref:YodC family protein n=1 Tax=Dyella sp. GSA-30 TaxID=2994496 RepID=UPI0024926AD5|nr:DUF2158 domain-containing protein [Dyella sp. GSA-30]BDU19971.1 hypothetical protein DYGSA30_14280 [Dyella sp. GSA-30]
MSEFKIGDTVQLKSGGPAMTVSELQEGGRVFCEWFDNKENHQERSFVASTLDKYDPGAGALGF